MAQAATDASPQPPQRAGFGRRVAGALIRRREASIALVALGQAGLRAGLSVKPTAMGLVLDPERALARIAAVVAAADESVITVDVQLVWDGKARAEASTLWKRWRPRS